MALTADFVTNTPVTFARMRQILEDLGEIQKGVVNAGDCKVTQRAAGANMSVDVAVGQAWIEIDTGTRNGRAHVVNDAVANATITAANATNPRIDQIVIQYNDAAIPAGTGGNVPTIRVIAGTATAGATLDNRTGAAVLPNDSLRLADVLVPAASSSVVNANIRDRRSWARGAFRRIIRNSNAGGTNDYSFTAAFALIDTTNLYPRIECTGVPITVELKGKVVTNATGHNTKLMMFVDGTGPDGQGTTDSIWQFATVTAAARTIPITFSHTFVPTAGSHRIGPAGFTDQGADIMSATGNAPLVLTVEEAVRQNADNS